MLVDGAAAGTTDEAGRPQRGEDALLLVNGGARGIFFALPDAPGGGRWQRAALLGLQDTRTPAPRASPARGPLVHLARRECSLVSSARHDEAERALLRDGTHHDPHRYLGVHTATRDGVESGRLLRAFHPDAVRCEALLGAAAPLELARSAPGSSRVRCPRARHPQRATACASTSPTATPGSASIRTRFPPTLGPLDLHLIAEGNHERLWEALGARPLAHEGVEGTAFAVWAPNATRVSVVGDFCRWDGRLLPDALARQLRRLGALRARRCRRDRSTSSSFARRRASCA